MVLRIKSSFSKYQNIFSLFIFIPAIILLLWKCPFSMGFEDETYYLAIPFRLTMGDSLIADEWHLAQLAGFLIYYPVKLYVAVVGSTEGIVLFFRYLFVAFHVSVSAVIYSKLKKFGIFGIFATLIYFLYIPNTIMSLNYNTMGLAFVELSGILMATTKKRKKHTFYIVGLLVACAVLCNPIFVFVYLAYTVAMVVMAIINKHHQINDFREILFSVKTWLWISLGIVTVALAFFSFLFSRTSLQELTSNLPMLFSDPDYRFSSSGSGGQNIFSIKNSLFEIIGINPYLFSTFILVTAITLLDKKRVEHRDYYLVFFSLLTLGYLLAILPFGDSGRYTFAPGEKLLYCTFPLFPVGLISYILTKKKDKQTFAFLWILGVLYAFCLDVASDLGTLAAIQGFAVLNTASVIFIKNIYDEIKEEKQKNPHQRQKTQKIKVAGKKLPAAFVATILISTLCFQGLVEVYVVANYKLTSIEHAMSGSKESLTTTIKTGPLKGLRTTSDREDIYKNMLNDLDAVKAQTKGPVLVTADFQWPYLYLDRPYATYSTYILDWFYASQNRLPDYYNLHPEKSPQYIYIPKVAPRFYVYDPDTAKKVFDDLISKHGTEYVESDVGYIVKVTHGPFYQ